MPWTDTPAFLLRVRPCERLIVQKILKISQKGIMSSYYGEVMSLCYKYKVRGKTLYAKK